MIKLIVNGACGHMGRTIIRLAQKQNQEFELLCGVDPSGVSESEGVPVVRELALSPAGADVVIDFSRPSALPAVLQYCQAKRIPLVLGTTGLSAEEKQSLTHAATKTPIFFSGNMSLGVNLQLELIKRATAALGEAFEPEITEKHHNRKVDAPSGTALMLAEALSSQHPGERPLVFGRHSKDARRTRCEIGIHAVRGGTVVGEHYVEFYGDDEVLEINHKAYSKQVFAVGALRAAQYIVDKQPGLYNMHDVVTERDVLSHLYTEENQAVISLGSLPDEPGVLSAVFGAVANSNVFVDMISTTAPGGGPAIISFSLPADQMAVAMNALNTLREKHPTMQPYAAGNITKITVEGPGMALRHGVAGQLFAVLAGAGVSIELVTTSETKISLCVKNSDVAAAVQSISAHFQL